MKAEITIINNAGQKIATISNCKTIKGALTQIKKSSIAIPAGCKIRIEYVIA